MNAFPVWSPDGQSLLFRSGAPPSLYRKPAAGGSNPQRVTSAPSAQLSPDWSADGKLIVYSQNEPSRKQDIWIHPVRPDGSPVEGAKPISFAQTPANELEARFFPEPSPRWIVYTSDESGQSEVLVQSFPEGKGKWQISSNGGRYPAWGPDGKEIFYIAQDGGLMSVKIKVSPDGMQKSAPEKLFDLPVEQTVSGIPYAISPDGQRILVRAIDDSNATPLHVITNWPSFEKKSTAASK